VLPVVILTRFRLWVFLGALGALAAAFGSPAQAQILAGAKPPEKNLLLIDVNEQPREVQFLVGALQGLVNRKSPRIYVKDDQYAGSQDSPLGTRLQDFSIPVLQTRGHTFEKIADYKTLLERFRTSHKGAVVYDAAAWTDPELADQINIVTALCGTQDLLPVTEALNQQLKLPVIMDVRGRWKSAEDAYRWAVGDEQLRRGISKRVLAHRHPWSLYMTDLLVSQSILPIWIGKDFSSDDSLVKLQKDLFALTPINTPVLGAWQSDWPKSPENSGLVGLDEPSLVKLISASGKFLIPVMSRGNFSVHSGIDIPEIKQKPATFRKLDREKVYVTFIASAGENISAFMLVRPFLWNDPNRGKVPMGWTFSPTMMDLAPHILAAHFESASANDCFVCGGAGLGSIMPGYGSATDHPDQAVSQYFELTSRYLSMTDAKLQWNGWMDEATNKEWAAKLPVEGIFLDAEPFAGSYRDSIRVEKAATSQPVVLVRNSGSAANALASEAELKEVVSSIKKRAGGLDRPRFVFIGFNGLVGTPSNVLRVAQQLPADYVVVRPDEFVDLIKQERSQVEDPRSAEERLVFQTSSAYVPRLHLNADVAINYGFEKNLAERIQSWKQAGFGIHVMTGVSWGNYQDYLYGRWDGVKHEDEAQTDKAGKKITHGGDTYYMSPGESYGKYLASGVKRAIDAGATAIHLEEPEFWVSGGYEPNFKIEWKRQYGDDWRPPESSADAQYRASKLKYLLYRRALSQVFDFVRSYSKEIGRDVKCYVASHSLINYAQLGIISPESSLADVGCDGYIAQVWTGTARTPNVYNDLTKERTFESAFLEYGQMANLVRGSGQRMWFLHDPVEDSAEHSWSDYRAQWESTVVASLLHPDVFRYEIMPWPERVFMREYPTTDPAKDQNGVDKKRSEMIPQAYATELQAVDAALGDMQQNAVQWETAGTRGIGVMVSDTMMFQRGNPTPSDKDLSNFFALSMPLVKAGIPVTPVQLENVQRENFLSPFKVLLLTYEGQKPLKPEFHSALAEWVKAGGALVVIDDDKDPYNGVSEWWNGKSHHYKTPRVHLFQQLGVPPDAAGVTKVGKGAVLYVQASPAALAHDASGGEKVRQYTKQACEAVGATYEESGGFALRRGPYVIAAGLDESSTGGALRQVISGRFLSLFDENLPLVVNPVLEAGKRYLLIDLEKAGPGPKVVAAAGRVRNVIKNADGLVFRWEGVEKTRGVAAVAMSGPPREILVDQKRVGADAWEFLEGVMRVRFENRAAGVEIQIKF
jgi:hypothetical protein